MDSYLIFHQHNETTGKKRQLALAKKTTRNIFTAAVAPTCCELAKRGLDFIRNLEPVIVAERP